MEMRSSESAHAAGATSAAPHPSVHPSILTASAPSPVGRRGGERPLALERAARGTQAPPPSSKPPSAASAATNGQGEPSDEELAMAAPNGDRSAFQALYQRYSERVFARLTKLIGFVPDRDDVMQTVFLQLHCALPSFRGDSSLSTFLHRITANVACDYLRKRGRQPLEFDDDALGAVVDEEPNPEDRSTSRERLAAIFKHLERLKPAKRVAFTLVAIEGVSMDEVALRLGVTPDAVKQRVIHARRELLAMLERAERRGRWQQRDDGDGRGRRDPSRPREG